MSAGQPRLTPIGTGSNSPARRMSVAAVAPLSQPSPELLSMKSADRPLSPHLQIYRWQLTSVLSILHRASGLWLGAGSILLVWWLAAAASGPQAYAGVADFLGSWIGLLFLFGWTLSLFYHLCNGVRHLAWDTGWGFDLKTAYRTGWTVVAATGALTAIAWILGIACWSR